MQNPNRTEAERLLGVAEKLLLSRDLSGSKDFAVLAQETEPLLEGSDQILAIVEVLLATEKRVNNHHDWYAILQIGPRSDEHDLIKRQYRRLALLLHPDKNKYPYADQAFRFVAGAWAVLSDPGKKSLYDKEFNLFSKVDLSAAAAAAAGAKLPVRRSGQLNRSFGQQEPVGGSGSGHGKGSEKPAGAAARTTSFWTACPYCYVVYEYPAVYEECCLRCQSCDRAFHAVAIGAPPPVVPGKEAYHCCWAVFPLGFTVGKFEGGDKVGPIEGGLPNWFPQQSADKNAGVAPQQQPAAAPAPKKKRGRPRKNPL
ncbi:chaperone protein DnaJ-like [Rhodamnia argentea]|uniref:Chaperone protein DnaJ-like n=1 Tax=Rhodamnia argentea TaxID=178133 RepID=A0A8B8Q8Z4_9MYRT|nr:chaperone protein DnaJ-like [Rhodamnia argentea]